MHDLRENLDKLRIVRDQVSAGHAGSVDLACVTQAVIDLIEDRYETVTERDEPAAKKASAKKTRRR